MECSVPSLDGRIFRDVTIGHSGDVGADTSFEYHEEDDVVWARYFGGTVRLGFLVGFRDGDHLEFRYSHVTTTGATASGQCVSEIAVLDDGRVELRERWQWTSKPGTGTSTLVEVT